MVHLGYKDSSYVYTGLHKLIKTPPGEARPWQVLFFNFRAPYLPWAWAAVTGGSHQASRPQKPNLESHWPIILATLMNSGLL